MRRMFGCSVTTPRIPFAPVSAHTRYAHARSRRRALRLHIIIPHGYSSSNLRAVFATGLPYTLLSPSLFLSLCFPLSSPFCPFPSTLALFLMPSSAPACLVVSLCLFHRSPPPRFSFASTISPSLIIRRVRYGARILRPRVFDMLDDEVLWSRITPLEGDFPPKKSFQAMSRM